MTVLEAVTQHIEAMRDGGIDIRPTDLLKEEVEAFGSLGIVSIRSRRGKRHVYTVFETPLGEIGWWPLATMGPRLGLFKSKAKGKAKQGR